MKKINQIYTSVALVLISVVLINLITSEWFVRFDYTEDKQYTLSNATINILKEIEEPVHVKAYFTSDLPENIGRVKQDFQDLLMEYASYSDGNIIYEFINPNEDEESKNKALQEGIQPVMVDVRENDERIQKQAFFGVILNYGEKKEVIPFIQPGGAMEYALTTSIKKVVTIDKPVLALIKGHGEYGKDRLVQVNNHLEMLYEVREYEIGEEDIPSYFKAIALIGIQDTVPQADFEKIDKYLSNGGNVFVAYDPINASLEQTFMDEKEIGVTKWLKEKGLKVSPVMATDLSCGNVTVSQQRGIFRVQNNVNFPYFPLLTKFEDHPTVSGLEAVLLQFPCPIDFVGDTTLRYTPIAQTSEKSGQASIPHYLNLQRDWKDTDFQIPNQTLSAILEGKIEGDKESKLIVITDGDLVDNGEPGRQQQVQADNVNLVANSLDWLADDSGLIELRSQGVNYRPLDEVEESIKTLLKYFNFFLPIGLILGYGLIRYQRRKQIRLKRQALHLA